MAIQPSRQTSQSTSLIQYTPANGYKEITQLSQESVSAYQPVPNPPILLGVDFTGAYVNGTVALTFANLPIRGSGSPYIANQNQPRPLYISPGELLMFEVSIAQGYASVTPQVTDASGILYKGPFIGPGTYHNFAVVVQTPQGQDVGIWGKLYLQRGAGQQ